MKESFWGIMIFVFGVVSILIVFFFQAMTNTSEHNYVLLKEATQGAMLDAIDLAYYRQEGKIRIDQEKFVENFVRRFAQSAQLSRDYVIEIYDVSEEPPKVSLAISSVEKTDGMDEILEFNLIDRLDAILEVPKNFCNYDTLVESSQGVIINMPTQTTTTLNQTTHWEKEGGVYTSDRNDSVADNGRYKIECTADGNTGKYKCQNYIRVSNNSSSSSSSSSSSYSQSHTDTVRYENISVTFTQTITGNTANGKTVVWEKSGKTTKNSSDISNTGTTSKRVCKCSRQAISNGKTSCVEYTCQDYKIRNSGHTEDQHIPSTYYDGDKHYPYVGSFTSSTDVSRSTGPTKIRCVCNQDNYYTGTCKKYICDRYQYKA